MFPVVASSTSRTLAHVEIADAYSDFVLSRQAMQCTKATMEFYRHTALRFLVFAEKLGASSPNQITAYLVRQYLTELAERGRKDTTIHDNARAIRTLLRFWHAENYTEKPVKFDMPRLSKKRLPVLSADDLKRAIEACESKRDKALLLFLADSGLRRSEASNLDWSDVDMQTGLIRVKQGKGKKDRSAVISPTVRRALLQYRRTLKLNEEPAFLRNGEPLTGSILLVARRSSSHIANIKSSPLFLSRTGERLTGAGILLIFRRLSKVTGLKITPHALRRTFAILSLRAGMDALHLQNLGGWANLDMVQHYAQMVDDDLLQAHSQHSPIEALR